MKTQISKTYAHDSAHFSFYRQTPLPQRDIPFEEEGESVGWAETALWAVALSAILAFLFIVLGL